MDKIKKIIIVIIVFIFILSIITLILVINVGRKNENIFNEKKNIDYIGEVGDELEITNEECHVDNMSKVMTVENVLQKYYNTININSVQYFEKNRNKPYVRVVSDEEIKKNIMDLLDEEYKISNNINENNFNDKVTIINDNVQIIILQMKELINDRIDKYCVNAVAINNDYKIISNFYTYVNLDYKNTTFSIEPIENVDMLFNEIKINNNNKEIKLNNNNQYTSVSLGHEETINKYLENFKRLAISDADISFNLLDEKYRNTKFKDKNEYKDYINKNKTRLQKANIIKYRVKYFNDYIEFTAVDQNNFYYIFKQEKNNPLNYTIILDTYTIDSIEFIEKYDEGESRQKVGMNIEKIFSSINCKDYDYLYSKLDETFKMNNLQNLNDLEKIIKDNVYDNNKVIYDKFTELGDGIYSYNISIQSVENESINNKKMMIVMKLLENRDFVLSFSFE